MRSKRSTAKIYTIGYEGRTLDEVVELMEGEKVALVADVRQNAVSRRPGFSKRRLSEALLERGIEYVHLSSLGTPKELRAALSHHGVTGIERIYRQRILVDESDTVDNLLTELHSRRVCLLCFERDASRCHRRLLTDELVSRDGRLEVTHV